MLVYCAIRVEELRAHHVIIWGSLLVAGLLPVWVAATGIFDHSLLVRVPRRNPDPVVIQSHE